MTDQVKICSTSPALPYIPIMINQITFINQTLIFTKLINLKYWMPIIILITQFKLIWFGVLCNTVKPPIRTSIIYRKSLKSNFFQELWIFIRKTLSAYRIKCVGIYKKKFRIKKLCTYTYCNQMISFIRKNILELNKKKLE